MQSALRIFLLACAVAFCAGCPADEDEPSDAGTNVEIQDAGVSDAGQQPASCLCEDQEDCPGCFEHIGNCCYEDITIEGQAEQLTAICENTPACKVCCNECKARSCEDLRASGDCPNLFVP